MVRALGFGFMALTWIGAWPATAATALFTDDAALHIVITAPFPALVRADKTSTDPYPANLTLSDRAGAPQSFAIQVRARGYTRRTAGFCRFPPLYLEFDKKSMHGSLFQGQHKLKLVTYCRPEADYEQRVVLEYLAYKLYNLVTPVSYRVRAAEVTYRGGEADPGVTRFGYLIEDAHEVADRNGLEELKAASHEVKPAQMDPQATARAALFEYMIANQDWEFLASQPGQSSCCHNTRLLAQPDASPATANAVAPLPYDYDWSGLVDSPYAGPPPQVPVEKVTDRYYRGYCFTTAQTPSVVEEYRAKRADMLALINGEPHLNASFRAKTVRFMNAFFAVLDDPARAQRDIIKHCR
jgi:hypothetical protein